MKYPSFNISSSSGRIGLTALLVISSHFIILPHRVTAGSNPNLTAQVPTTTKVLYVNPTSGTDTTTAGTTAASPYKTLTFALAQAQPGTVVQLAGGNYSSNSGETFPIIIPEGVTVQGNDSTKGQEIVILGGGLYISRTFAKQNIAILANKNTTISGVTVTNPNQRGTGIWVESSNPLIENSTFTNSVREGVFVTGTGNPQILNNIFVQNQGNGISVAKFASGEIRNNLIQNTGFGLAIGGSSTPLISENRIIQNRDGLYISESSRPILRKNDIENNTQDGIVVTIAALPDIGTNNSPGGNYIHNNTHYDLNNSTRSQRLPAVGNDINQKGVFGAVDLISTTINPATIPVANNLPTPVTRPLVTNKIPPSVPIPVPKLVTTQLAQPTNNRPGNFNDVPTGYWAKAYIDALIARNAIAGFPDGSFRPNDSVTRAQFATIITKALTPTSKRQVAKFSDIKPNYWAYSAIQAAYTGQFISGYPDGNFKPDQKISRVQVLVSLANGLGLFADKQTVLGLYTDAAQIPNYATGQVAAATLRQLVVNYPLVNLLDPNREATRAEIAAFVYQALVNSGQAAAIQSPYLVKGQ